ncbi:hypothetical protein OIU77_024944 [Salix suchowensis]|uniref:Uncharacterized protein n=1 Tax=Salix suchowensis TaxID=1278906 RepID=A0ABQ9BUH1_9ROSI|nr:hypothetical protein OIU77_024944 [Salix suchowensis]
MARVACSVFDLYSRSMHDPAAEMKGGLANQISLD